MKKKVLFPILLLLVLVAGCEKQDLNPEYPFTIIVKTYEDSVRVNNIFVEVTTTLTDDNVKVDMEGITDINGEASFTYDQDAVLFVRATRGRDPFTWIGCNFVRLEPNTRVRQTVYIRRWNPQLTGCLDEN